MNFEEATGILRSVRGSSLDKRIVDAFLNAMRDGIRSGAISLPSEYSPPGDETVQAAS